ncbi:hypothetical protein ACO0K7_19255 [Undibacterium sp. Ji67W]
MREKTVEKEMKIFQESMDIEEAKDLCLAAQKNICAQFPRKKTAESRSCFCVVLRGKYCQSEQATAGHKNRRCEND